PLLFLHEQPSHSESWMGVSLQLLENMFHLLLKPVVSLTLGSEDHYGTPGVLPDSLHLRYEGRLTADVMLGLSHASHCLGQAIHERGLVCLVASYGDE
ncbi:MAG: hypothetical protein ABWY64_27480, partial [Tardiphaga sp.]